MANATLDKAPPPYMSASLLKSTVDRFVNAIVPTTFDRHVLSGISGAEYGALMSGLRFLGLVEANGNKPTEKFRALVKAREKSEDDYQSELLMVLNNAYDKIVGAVDIDSGTLGELEKAFRTYGVPPGQMLSKTVRFYIKAMQESGITPSSYITKPRRGGSAGAPKKTTDTKTKGKTKTTRTLEPDVRTLDVRTPAGFHRMPVPGVEGAFVQYPTDLTETDCSLFEAIVGVLRQYAQSRPGRKEKA